MVDQPPPPRPGVNSEPDPPRQPGPPSAPQPDPGPGPQPGPSQWAYPAQPWYPGQPAYPAASAYGPHPSYSPGYSYAPLGPGYLDPNDPLVPPPGAGLDGWFTRVVGAVRRNWPILLPIVIITQLVPALVLDVAALGPAFDPSAGLVPTPDPHPAANPFDEIYGGGKLLALVGLLFGGVVVLSLLQSAGTAAGTWAIARQAVGEPVRLGTALRYGLRRALGLWGWSLLSGLLIMAGVCACFLPGIYLAFALSMVGPVFLFERSNPMGRSFQMFHARLGMMLGRLSLIAAAIVGVGVVIGLAQEVARVALGAEVVGFSVATVTSTVAGDLLSLPIYVVLLVGLLITYAEQRGQEAPVNAARLAEELG